jgi:hypothetical protein
MLHEKVMTWLFPHSIFVAFCCTATSCSYVANLNKISQQVKYKDGNIGLKYINQSENGGLCALTFQRERKSNCSANRNILEQSVGTMGFFMAI